MSAYPMRTIREDDNVAIVLDNCKHARAEDVWDGLKWKLCRQPEMGIAITNDAYYLMKSADMGNPTIPIITVLYSFSAEQVQVRDIRISEIEEA